jgi:signal transduction histidine kinase
LLDSIAGANYAQVGEVRSELDIVTAELNRLAEGLYPADATRVPVAAQLHALAQTLAPPAGLHVAGRMNELPDELRVLVHFVVAECVTNVARYAPGSETIIDLQVTDVVLVLRVVDDGPGGANIRPGGGFEGLADRAALVGGALRVTSPPGGPTEVRVEIPLS